MRPAVPAGSLVVASRVDPAAVQAGEIVTFRHSTAPSTPVTHRVVKVLREANGTVNLMTKGDANATADPEVVATDLPVSRMVFSVPWAGYVLEFSRTGAGKIAFIAVPGLILLLGLGRRTPLTPAAADTATTPPMTAAAPTVDAGDAPGAWDAESAAAETVAAAMKDVHMVSTPAASSSPALARLAQRPGAVPQNSN